MNFVCTVFEKGDEKLTLLSMEKQMVECNLQLVTFKSYTNSSKEAYCSSWIEFLIHIFTVGDMGSCEPGWTLNYWILCVLTPTNPWQRNDNYCKSLHQGAWYDASTGQCQYCKILFRSLYIKIIKTIHCIYPPKTNVWHVSAEIRISTGLRA